MSDQLPAAEAELPPDQSARDRIRTDLDTTLFVEAGAGAGKTRSLVERVVSLVERGTKITEIAAITFTEKAAAELRQRIRATLQARLDDQRADWALEAIATIDHAPIGTLHAFARRILNDFPIEAGLPPGFGVLDELESNLRFDEEWEALLDRLLDDPTPAGGDVEGGLTFAQLCEFERFGLQTGLRNVAVGFRYNWDLVDELVDRSDPGSFHLEAITGVADLVATARSIATTETPEGDRQTEMVARIGAHGAAIAEADLLRLRLEAIEGLAGIKPGRCGAKGNWKSLGEERLAELRDRESALAEAASEVVRRVREYRKRLVGAICARFTLGAVAERVDAGVLDFHDLLVHARRLVRSHPEVRRRLHESYPVILLDEFQDTDPIQLEIAVRLTAAPDDPAHDGAWRELTPLPGRLFIVGDPKQSIYRFRRADIGQYLRAADQVGADTALLSANFRSTDAVIDVVNDVFASIITENPGSQPAFQPLVARRRAALRTHGSVRVVGADHHPDLDGRAAGLADELRRREAVDVADAVATALRDEWPVGDDDQGELRPCRPGDICVLIPTRLSLPALETALREHGISYRVEGSSAVYGSREVRDLLLTLRAADDPTDELALVEALRTPLFGCSDVELWEWKRDGGSWGLFRPAPDELADHPVARSIERIRSIHDRIPTTGVADLLTQVIDDSRMFDVALSGPDHRDVWRRLRFVVDQARAWADAGGRGLRRYLAWAHRQAVEGRVAETILPETDHDAVRIMTVHASKGLEFPITVVAGMTTQRRKVRGVNVVWPPGGGSWALTGTGDDGAYDEIEDLDIQMDDAERRRLLYVACTRAVDHLIVSLHRSRDGDAVRSTVEATPEKATSAELLWEAGAADAPGVRVVPAAVPPQTAPGRSDADDDNSLRRTAHANPAGAENVERWRARLHDTLAQASVRSAIAATRLADEVRMLREQDLTDDPGLDKQPVNIDLPPWQRGRYGTSIGRAVHGTLQFCDLATGDDIEQLARSQCAAEGIIGSDRAVTALARSALAAPIVRAVADGAEHWRELFIAAPVGGRVLEGYIDLLVRTPDGLVIVDYKTDRWSGSVQTEERISRYRTQLAAYGAALEATLDEPVVGGLLVHCVEGERAEEIDVANWAQALDEVRTLVG